MSSTTAKLVYSNPPADGSRAYVNVNVDTTTGQRERNSIENIIETQIENLRGKEDTVSLDTAGFQFYKKAANHVSFANDAEIEKEYYPESIELIKELTGATRVVLFDHSKLYLNASSIRDVSNGFHSAIRRRRPGEVEDTPQKRQPVASVHVDQTTASAIARVHRHLPPTDAPSLLKRRFQIINLWRPISHAALDWPLALCDYRSVDAKKDLYPVALIYPDREGETFGVSYTYYGLEMRNNIDCP